MRGDGRNLDRSNEDSFPNSGSFRLHTTKEPATGKKIWACLMKDLATGPNGAATPGYCSSMTPRFHGRACSLLLVAVLLTLLASASFSTPPQKYIVEFYGDVGAVGYEIQRKTFYTWPFPESFDETAEGFDTDMYAISRSYGAAHGGRFVFEHNSRIDWTNNLDGTSFGWPQVSTNIVMQVWTLQPNEYVPITAWLEGNGSTQGHAAYRTYSGYFFGANEYKSTFGRYSYFASRLMHAGGLTRQVNGATYYLCEPAIDLSVYMDVNGLPAHHSELATMHWRVSGYVGNLPFLLPR